MIKILSFVLVAFFMMTTPVSAEEILSRGTIKGSDGHNAGGTVQFVRLDDGSIEVRLSKDFYVDSVPDAYLGFGNPKYIDKSRFVALKQLRGKQSHKLPKRIKLASYSHFYIWCRAIKVAIGVAKLEK